MGALDGFGGKIDPNYDWTNAGGDFWEHLGEDDGDLRHFYDKGSCWQQNAEWIWWIHRYGKPGEFFVYLLCCFKRGSDRILVPAMKNLSDPAKQELEPPAFKQMIGVLSGPDLALARETEIGLSQFDEAIPAVQLWGGVHANWTTPPYILYGSSFLQAPSAPNAEHFASRKRGWLDRLLGTGGTPTLSARREEARSQDSSVRAYRAFAKQNGCAPTSNISDRQIEEVHQTVTAAFASAARQKSESLSQNTLNAIVLKFLQVYESFGHELFSQHLEYELQKYVSEGLRPEYGQGIQLS